MTSPVSRTERINVVGAYGWHAETVSQFFQRGLALWINSIATDKSHVTSAHFSVLGLPCRRGAHTHHGQSQHQRSNRLQVTVCRVQQKGNKSPQLLKSRLRVLSPCDCSIPLGSINKFLKLEVGYGFLPIQLCFLIGRQRGAISLFKLLKIHRLGPEPLLVS